MKVNAAGAFCLLYCNLSEMLDGGYTSIELAQR